MIARLGVNIDHVATLRQARGEFYPQVTRACEQSIKAGADQITIHLREDRRHIQDQDIFEVKEVTDEYNVPLNLELGCDPGIIDQAIKLGPTWFCVVPEKREERTTEGGLDLLTESQFSRIAETCEKIKKAHPKSKISLFVEAKKEILEKVLKLPVDAVEIHTGDYAKKFLGSQDYRESLKSFVDLSSIIKESKLGYHAGHGLTYESLIPLLELRTFSEYNIGHWIISESVFEGLSSVVRKLSGALREYPIN